MLRCGEPRGLPAANPYAPIDIIIDVEGKRVTIWKTILSLFLVFGVNGFEGVELLSKLEDSRKAVCGGL